ncbi:hypothetical protein [Streptomyces sp. NPDC087317]|uniref:hypothetical protein n=1 Tax=Streptomyces sp. NPDC087317 TaxID=3365784 RepID=UPI00380AA34A
MALNARRNRQLLKAAVPLLLAEECVELTNLAGVGSVSVRRQAVTAAAGLKVTFPVQNRGDGPRFAAALPVTR